MEIGSFLELDLRKTGEYFPQEKDIARLNTGRAAIYHAVLNLGVNIVYLPYYLCPTVKDFLLRKGVEVRYYYITKNLEPQLARNDKNSAVLIVNYFGIISNGKIIKLSEHYQNVIIDNSPAFFSPPVNNCFNVYSARKFFGVPDGAYVTGSFAEKGADAYGVDESSETSGFLLKRIEKGSSKVYAERMENESRLDTADILQMSKLSHRLLQAIDYSEIRSKRQHNFHYAHSLFHSMNLFDPLRFMDQNCVPMVYPLVIEDYCLMESLRKEKIYTGRWWESVLKMVPKDSLEAYLSRYMLPIPIDQRYGKSDLNHIHEKLTSLI